MDSLSTSSLGIAFILAKTVFRIIYLEDALSATKLSKGLTSFGFSFELQSTSANSSKVYSSLPGSKIEMLFLCEDY